MGTYDLMEVADVIQMLSRKPCEPLGGCDPARMQFLTNWLERECGITVAQINQSPAIMCPASELLSRTVETHNAAFSNTPVLAQHCLNAVAAESKAYGRRLASEKNRHGQGTKRIDAAIAAAMAMWAYDNNEKEEPTVWTIDL